MTHPITSQTGYYFEEIAQFHAGGPADGFIGPPPKFDWPLEAGGYYFIGEGDDAQRHGTNSMKQRRWHRKGQLRHVIERVHRRLNRSPGASTDLTEVDSVKQSSVRYTSSKQRSNRRRPEIQRRARAESK